VPPSTLDWRRGESRLAPDDGAIEIENCTNGIRPVYGGTLSNNGTSAEVTMRKLWIVGAVVSSLVLAACGVTASIDQAVSSIGASPNLQVHLTASASGAGTAQAQGILSALSMDMRYSSTNGGALSQSGGLVNSEITVNSNAQTLFDLRQVDKNLYVQIDVTALASIPGIGATTQQLATIQLVLGGRWFEFPQSLLKSYLPTTTVSSAQLSEEQATARAMLDALSALISKTPYKTLPGGGYSQTGTLDSVVKAVVPALDGLTGKSLAPSTVQGTYTIGFTMSGATATGGSLSITAPNGTKGDATVSLHASLTHDAQTVDAPSGATVITRALLAQLLSQAMGASSSLG
jgi:outer membrane murein-binding lipoprotein Lpp